jgi:hypothetical protein
MSIFYEDSKEDKEECTGKPGCKCEKCKELKKKEDKKESVKETTSIFY